MKLRKLADSYAKQKANEIKTIIDEDLAVSRVMAEAVEPYDFSYRMMRETNEGRSSLTECLHCIRSMMLPG